MSGRTPQEREAARLERERRRALARGEAPPAEPAPPPPAEPPADPEPASEPPPAPAQPAEPEPHPEPPEPEPEPAAPAPRRVFPSAAVDPGHLEDDTPIGTVRAQPGAPGMPHRPVSVPRRRRKPGRVLFLLLAAGIVAVVGLFLVWSLFNPFKGEGSGPDVVVRIPSGASASQVGDLLARRDIVSSGFFFSLRAALTGDRERLRSGTYRLKEGMSNAAALEVLTTAPVAAKTLTVVIPEGPGRREVAPIVARAGVTGSYVRASERSRELNPRRYGAPRGASLEGFLFPATYELRTRDASATRLVRDQLRAFERNFGTVSLRQARRRNLTAYDVLIIASMIERETAVARERRLVSSVIYNRLREGIPLGIDATTRYAENNWTRPLKVSELERDSPYNTRRNRGLPPTPIGNPGLASIRAAANPASTSFLFYVVKPCGEGAHNFSRTDAEFQRDVAAYNAKRAELGGKDPSTCPK